MDNKDIEYINQSIKNLLIPTKKANFEVVFLDEKKSNIVAINICFQINLDNDSEFESMKQFYKNIRNALDTEIYSILNIHKFAQGTSVIMITKKDPTYITQDNNPIINNL